MDDVDREFALLAASVERTARVQKEEVARYVSTGPRERIARTAVESHSSDGMELRRGAVLARHLTAAYDALLAHVEERRADYATLPDSEAKRGAVTELRQLVAGARSLHRALAWVDAARTPPLDLGTRYLVDHTAAHLIAPEAEVTVVAGERSYGKVSNPLSGVFALSGANAPAPELAIVVFLPRRERRSGLLHPLIIHELGHAADDQHHLVGAVLEAAAEDAELMGSLGTAAASQAAITGEDEAVVGQALGARIAAWVEEAVCDAFAVQQLGPTYLYSFMAIVGTSDLDQAGPEHPPTRQRIRLVLEHLRELGWLEGMRDVSEEITTWFQTTADSEPVYEDPEERFCVETLARLAEEIRRVVGEHVGNLTFSAQDFDEVSSEIRDLLAAGIPPSQTRARDPIARPAIILGSWIFAVRRQGSDLAALARAADVPELSRLLPKALQDAAVLEAWTVSS